TLVTNPAISIPCGIDEHAMPFGLQVTGRFRGDRELLDAAEAMEQAFADVPGLGRPRPDLGKLARPTVDLNSIATHPPLQATGADRKTGRRQDERIASGRNLANAAPCSNVLRQPG